MRNGDFSASSVPIFDPLTGDPATGAGRTQFPGNVIPADRISPIARRILANVPNIAGAALGSVNYQDATVRERRTDGFDVKFNYQLSPKDQLSVRYSGDPTVFEAPQLRRQRIGGYTGRLHRTGVNKTQSAAGNWTRTLTNTFVMDARFGVSTYYNEALSAGSGLNAADVGIPGANLDTYTSGMTTINLQGPRTRRSASRRRCRGDRGETTYTAAGDDQAVGQPHDQVRRRLPPQQRLPAADAGPGRTARLLHLQRRPDRRAEHRRDPEQRRQCHGRVPARSSEQRRS